jgi:hypothetical protein
MVWETPKVPNKTDRLHLRTVSRLKIQLGSFRRSKSLSHMFTGVLRKIAFDKVHFIPVDGLAVLMKGA